MLGKTNQERGWTIVNKKKLRRLKKRNEVLADIVHDLNERLEALEVMAYGTESEVQTTLLVDLKEPN